MPPPLPQGCLAVPACLDYRAYVFTMPERGAGYAGLCEGLKGLGRIRHEALGVVYVDTAWGFLVVPPAGFPELKINFYRQTAEATVEQVLRRIAVILAEGANG